MAHPACFGPARMGCGLHWPELSPDEKWAEKNYPSPDRSAANFFFKNLLNYLGKK
jgi:hypothetical protein